LQIKDQVFEEQERAFHNTEKGIRNFVRNLEMVLFQINEVVMSQLHNSESIYNFINDPAASNDEYRIAQIFIANELCPQFVSFLGFLLVYRIINYYIIMEPVFLNKDSFGRVVRRSSIFQGQFVIL